MTEFRRMLRDRLLDLGAEHVEFVHPGGRHPRAACSRSAIGNAG